MADDLNLGGDSSSLVQALNQASQAYQNFIAKNLSAKEAIQSIKAAANQANLSVSEISRTIGVYINKNETSIRVLNKSQQALAGNSKFYKNLAASVDQANAALSRPARINDLLSGIREGSKVFQAFTRGQLTSREAIEEFQVAASKNKISIGEMLKSLNLYVNAENGEIRVIDNATKKLIEKTQARQLELAAEKEAQRVSAQANVEKEVANQERLRRLRLEAAADRRNETRQIIENQNQIRASIIASTKTSQQQNQIGGIIGSLVAGAKQFKGIATTNEIFSYQKAVAGVIEKVRTLNITADRFREMQHAIWNNLPLQQYTGDELKIAQALLLVHESEEKVRKAVVGRVAANQRALDQAREEEILARRKAFAQQQERKTYTFLGGLEPTGPIRGDSRDVSTYLSQKSALLKFVEDNRINANTVRRLWKTASQGIIRDFSRFGPESAQTFLKLQEHIRDTAAAMKTMEIGSIKRGLDELTLSWQTLVRIATLQLLHRGVTSLTFAIRDAVKASIELEMRINEIRTLTQSNGQITSTYREWQDAILDLSKAYGTDLIQNAEAAYEALSDQLIDTSNQFKQLGQILNEFAITTRSSVAEAERLMAAAMNSFNLSLSDAEQIAASFFKTIDLGRVRASEMDETLGQVAVTVGQVGGSLDELQAMIATATIRGIRYREVATQIRGVMTALIRPTEAMTGFIHDLGFESGEAAIRSLGLPNFLRLLSERSAGSSSELAALIPRVRGLNVAMILGGEGLSEYNNNLEQIRNSQEEYRAAVDLMTNSSAVKFQRELQKIRAALIETGGSLIQTAANLVGGINHISVVINGLVAVVKTVFLPAAAAFIFATRNMWLSLIGLNLTIGKSGEKFLQWSRFMETASGKIGIFITAASLAVSLISLLATAQQRYLDNIKAVYDTANENLQRQSEENLERIASDHRRTLEQIQNATRETSLQTTIIGEVISERVTTLYDEQKRLFEDMKKNAKEFGDVLRHAIESQKSVINDLEEDFKALDEKIRESGDNAANKAFERSQRGASPAERILNLRNEIERIDAEREIALQTHDVERYNSMAERERDLLYEVADAQAELNDQLRQARTNYNNIHAGQYNVAPFRPLAIQQEALRASSGIQSIIHRLDQDILEDQRNLREETARRLEIERANLRIIERESHNYENMLSTIGDFLEKRDIELATPGIENFNRQIARMQDQILNTSDQTARANLQNQLGELYRNLDNAQITELNRIFTDQYQVLRDGGRAAFSAIEAERRRLGLAIASSQSPAQQEGLRRELDEYEAQYRQMLQRINDFKRTLDERYTLERLRFEEQKERERRDRQLEDLNRQAENLRSLREEQDAILSQTPQAFNNVISQIRQIQEQATTTIDPWTAGPIDSQLPAGLVADFNRSNGELVNQLDQFRSMLEDIQDGSLTLPGLNAAIEGVNVLLNGVAASPTSDTSITLIEQLRSLRTTLEEAKRNPALGMTSHQIDEQRQTLQQNIDALTAQLSPTEHLDQTMQDLADLFPSQITAMQNLTAAIEGRLVEVQAGITPQVAPPSSSSPSGGNPSVSRTVNIGGVTVNANTNANPSEIASAVVTEIRRGTFRGTI